LGRAAAVGDLELDDTVAGLPVHPDRAVRERAGVADRVGDEFGEDQFGLVDDRLVDPAGDQIRDDHLTGLRARVSTERDPGGTHQTLARDAAVLVDLVGLLVGRDGLTHVSETNRRPRRCGPGPSGT